MMVKVLLMTKQLVNKVKQQCRADKAQAVIRHLFLHDAKE